MHNRLSRLAAATLASALMAGGTLLISGSGAVAHKHPWIVDASPQFGVTPYRYRAGWQTNYVYDVPTGAAGVFFHFPCGGRNTIPVSGTFVPNSTAEPTIQLLGLGRRIDGSPTEWFWRINFAGNAPAGSQITFNAYCANH